MAKEGSVVWGVCYEVDKSALTLLDRYEGVYSQVVVTVENTEGQKTRAITYISESIFSNAVTPSRDYLEIVELGAKEQNLPSDYIAQICKEVGL